MNLGDLDLLRTENDTLESPIFFKFPKVNTDSFRVLLRTLAGLEDFARTTSHYARRKRHLTLRTSHYSRGCLLLLLSS